LSFSLAKKFKLERLDRLARLGVVTLDVHFDTLAHVKRICRQRDLSVDRGACNSKKSSHFAAFDRESLGMFFEFFFGGLNRDGSDTAVRRNAFGLVGPAFIGDGLNLRN